MSHFDEAFRRTIDLERGYVNDPADRGGETNYGITAKTLRAAVRVGIVSETTRISTLTLDEAKKIYRCFYWDALRLDRITDCEIAAEVFDTAVNMGLVEAVRIAQRALNYLGENLGVDGILGPKTLDALERWSRKDSRALFVCLNGLQFMRYVALVEADPTQQGFARGWTRRIQRYRGEVAR